METHYDDEYFFGGGAGYADYLSESGLLIAHGERYARLLDRHNVPVGDMLDVGSAAGFVMRGFANRGWNPQGLEPNESMAGTATDAFGFPVRWGDLENFESATQFDLITMIQVVAHFHDVHAAMSAAARHTKNGGHWLIETWNHRSLTARLFGTQWHEYSPPSVLQWFSPASLTRLAAEYGMKVIALGRPPEIHQGRARSIASGVSSCPVGMVELAVTIDQTAPREIDDSLPLRRPLLVAAAKRPLVQKETRVVTEEPKVQPGPLLEHEQPNRSPPWSTVAISVAIGIVMRLLGLRVQAYSNDEVYELLAIQESWNFQIFEADGFPPLHRILLSLVVDTFDNDEAARWMSVAFGLLVIPLCCLAVRHLLAGRPHREIRLATLWTGLLTATSPLLVYFSQEGRAYAQFHLLAAAFILASIWALKSDSVASWIGTILVAFVGCFTHYHFTLLAVCLGIAWLFAAAPTGRWRRGVGAAIVFTLLLAPLLFLLKSDFDISSGYQTKTDFSLIGVPYAFFTLVAGFGFGPGVRELHEMPATQAAMQFLPWVVVCGLFSVPAWLQGIRSLGGPLERRASSTLPALTVFLVTLTLLPCLIAAVMAFSMNLPFNVRYVSASVLPCMLLIAIGISSIRRSQLSMVLGIAIVLLFVWSHGRRSLMARYQNEDMRAAAAYLADRPNPDSRTFIIVDYMARTLAYYTGPDVPITKLPDPTILDATAYIGNEEDLAEAIHLLRAAIRKHGTCTLVVTRAFHSDKMRLFRDWLAETNEFQLDREFAGVQIYRPQQAAKFTSTIR